MLEQRIKQEIENNIVLEEDHSGTEGEEPTQISMDEYLTEDDTPSYKSRLNHFSKDDRPRNFQISGGRSLQDSLIEQLGFKNLNQRQKTIAEFIIGSIDNDGYLRRDLQSLSDDMAFTLGIEVDIPELEQMLDIIQHLEPTGVGARDLRECLLLQLGSHALDSEEKILAYTILENHFDEFVKKHYQRMINRLGTTEDIFRAAVQEIQHLQPKPGNLFSEDSDSAPYIIPDFILDYNDGEFDLTLNSYNIPELKINRHYLDVIRQNSGKSEQRMSESEKEAMLFVKSKIDAA